jgi:tetratricopeptide (TPR) repeat protein
LCRELKEKYSDDKFFIFRVDNTEGLFYLAQGSWDKAECIYREKIVPESANHSPQNQAKAYFNWGKVLARLGKLDSAESCYLKAIELSEENNLVTLLAGLRSDLGALRWRQGKHLQAKADLEAGLRIAYAAGDLSVQSVTIDTLAAVKGELGETEGIVELFERNLKLKKSLNNRLGEVCSLLNLAECYCQGIGCKADHALAYERAKKALGLLNEIGSKKFMAEALINLCLASIKLGRRSEAMELAEAALSHATQTSSIVNTALAQGCKGMALAGINPIEAEKFLGMAIAGFSEIGNGYEEARHRVELAGLLRENGRLQEAGDAARKAMALYRNLNLNKPLAKLMDEFPDLLPAVPVRSAPKNRHSSSPARILVLGKLEIIPAGSDAPLAVGAKGQLVRKILAYLVTTDYNSKSGIDRKEILELFWGDDSFGGSMRVMLSRLKKSLGTSVTLFSSSRYSFAWKDPSVSLDREQFDDLWASGLSLEQKGNLPEAWAIYEQAESLFRGKYLDGMNEPWIKPTRSLMANTHRRLLQKLIALSQKVNKPEEARHFKKKLTSL